jgi:hypothetical protein
MNDAVEFFVDLLWGGGAVFFGRDCRGETVRFHNLRSNSYGLKLSTLVRGGLLSGAYLRNMLQKFHVNVE